MSVKLGLITALMAMQITIPLGRAPHYDPPPKAPIGEAGPAWAAACSDWDKGDKPAPPVRIHANTYLVGTCGISVILITGDDGDVLIDGGPDNAADLVADNIRQLGVKLSDIRFILHSHEHPDHVGGIARLQQLTGATLVASAPAAKVFASGTASADDPQSGMNPPFPAATVGRIVGDGDTVRLGNLLLTAMATPGHTPGALSWRWDSCDGGVCRTIVYADSLTPMARKNYRFADHPAALAAFRASIARIAASPCDILLTPHPSGSDLRTRISAGKPLLDPDGCRAYAAGLSRALDERLATEATR